ncbi:MAG: GTPase HflX, partial [Actinomycetota bacterium]
ADLILHVVDASDPDPIGQIATVRQVISEVEASAVPELVVLNKADLVSEETQVRLRGMIPGVMLVSARTGLGMEELEVAIAQLLPKPDQEFFGVLPYSRGDLVSRIHLQGKVIELQYKESGTEVRAMVKPELYSELKDFEL